MSEPNKSIVILSTLSIVTTCLALLNLYLAVWLLGSRQAGKLIWSRGDTIATPKPIINERISLNSFSVSINEQAIRFFPRLISKQRIDVATIGAKSPDQSLPMRISSSSSPIEFNALVKQAKFQKQTQNTTNKIHQLEVNDFDEQVWNIFKLNPRGQKMMFSLPFQVVEIKKPIGSDMKKQKVLLKCDPAFAIATSIISDETTKSAEKNSSFITSGRPICQFADLRKLIVPNRRGISIESLRTDRVSTRRIHSATNRLILRSTNDISFQSRSAKLTVMSFSDLKISSLKSHVSC